MFEPVYTADSLLQVYTALFLTMWYKLSLVFVMQMLYNEDNHFGFFRCSFSVRAELWNAVDIHHMNKCDKEVQYAREWADFYDASGAAGCGAAQWLQRGGCRRFYDHRNDR